ncbi:type IV toxin-antitoxin system AbiEi family antitoxin domain-containing protein [Sulfurimonas sp.]|uniref:type IV toxin-antitoxin system AbiEi family antitoxin domain-containing protein n=1 Tax=Sulfurimonas sp. TaxID=2022749 RepID=UPI003D140E14
MKTIEIQNNLSLSIFSHEMLYALLEKSISNVNDKISNLVKNGELLRLKKGFYTFSKTYLERPLDLINVANALYAPSYVSFDYALSYYGMIPERVNEVTSATSKNEKLYETPVGRFSYKKVPLQAYSLGVDWIYDEKDGGKFIATPEKALCDKIRYDRGIGTLTQNSMIQYLKYDLRLDIINPLDTSLIEEIATAYRSKNLKTLSQVLKKGKI